MKKLTKLGVLLAVAAFLMVGVVGCGGKKAEDSQKDTGAGDTGKKFTFKLGHLANEQDPWHLAVTKFAETVKEKSNGRIEVKVYPNESLGKEMDLIQGIQSGTVDMTITGESLQNWAPKAALLAAPYAFRDSAHLKQVAEGPIGDEIEQQITEKTGLLPIAYFERGPRNLSSNRPIKSPDELNGLLMRVPNVPLFVDTWKALGAKPTPMAFGEVFTGLQQHTIEAQENPLALVNSGGFYEVQKYINRTEHVRSFIYVVIGKKQFESMPEDLQKIFLEAATEMQVYEQELFVKDEAKVEQALKDKGMEFVDVNKAAFEEKAKPAVLNSLKGEQKDLYEKIINTK